MPQIKAFKAHYDPSSPLKLATNASASLQDRSHNYEDEIECPVAEHTDNTVAKRNYTQIEKRPWMLLMVHVAPYVATA